MRVRAAGSVGPALREYRPFPYHVCDVQVIPEYKGSEVVLVQHLLRATHHAKCLFTSPVRTGEV